MRAGKKILALLLTLLLWLAAFPVTAGAADVTKSVTTWQELFDVFNTTTSPIIGNVVVTIQNDIEFDEQIGIKLGNGGSVTIKGAAGSTPVLTMKNSKKDELSNGTQRRFLYVTYGGSGTSASLHAENLVFRESGYGSGSGIQGGAIYFDGGAAASLSASNCSFLGNQGNDGGAIYYGGTQTLTLTNCLFQLNQATGKGGAICADGSDIVLTNCDFYSNTAKGSNTAGAIDNGTAAGSLTIKGDCYFDSNTPAGTLPADSPCGIRSRTGDNIYFMVEGTIHTGRRPQETSSSGDPVLPMSLPADFTARRATAMLSMPVDGAPVMRPIGYYYTVSVLRLAENGYVEVTYRGQTGYIPLKDLGRSEGLTW